LNVSEHIVISIVTGLVVICVTTVLPLCIVYLKRTERMRTQQPLPVPDIVARLERMEMGMDSMSAEIERIGEGQRFTTRLLNERDPRALENVNAATRSN
jgi:hypothetical protein